MKVNNAVAFNQGGDLRWLCTSPTLDILIAAILDIEWLGV
jgi:hypothetical protein